jgi:hypothetical protein
MKKVFLGGTCNNSRLLKHPNYGDVGGCLKYNQKTAYGYIWKFKEN